jgi:hypothetical protein
MNQKLLSFIFLTPWSFSLWLPQSFMDLPFKSKHENPDSLHYRRFWMEEPVERDTLRSDRWYGLSLDAGWGVGRDSVLLITKVVDDSVKGTVEFSHPSQHFLSTSSAMVSGYKKADSAFLAFKFMNEYSPPPHESWVYLTSSCIKQIFYRREIVGDTVVMDVAYMQHWIYGTYEEPLQLYATKGVFMVHTEPVRLPLSLALDPETHKRKTDK